MAVVFANTLDNEVALAPRRSRAAPWDCRQRQAPHNWLARYVELHCMVTRHMYTRQAERWRSPDPRASLRKGIKVEKEQPKKQNRSNSNSENFSSRVKRFPQKLPPASNRNDGSCRDVYRFRHHGCPGRRCPLVDW